MKLYDRLLDALDDAPQGRLLGAEGHPSHIGQLATIQWLASHLRVSDSAARRAVHQLREWGLVAIWDALDPETRRRRLYISGAQG